MSALLDDSEWKMKPKLVVMLIEMTVLMQKRSSAVRHYSDLLLQEVLDSSCCC